MKHTKFWQLKDWTNSLRTDRYSWQQHVLLRMAERGISQAEALQILLKGECIEEYAADRPFPSALFIGERRNGQPLHVVAAFDSHKNWVFIITAYEPNLGHFQEGFRKRRKR